MDVAQPKPNCAAAPTAAAGATPAHCDENDADARSQPGNGGCFEGSGGCAEDMDAGEGHAGGVGKDEEGLAERNRLPVGEVGGGEDGGGLPLPDGWSAQVDAERGLVYFFNAYTGESRWEPPELKEEEEEEVIPRPCSPCPTLLSPSVLQAPVITWHT